MSSNEKGFISLLEWRVSEAMNLRSLKPAVGRYFPLRLLQELRIEVEGAATHFATAVLPRRAVALRRARSLRGLQVILGAGDIKNRDGWHTVDFRSCADFQIDMRRGLPFADGSCRFLFSEHVFEHLDLAELRAVVAECYRVLQPGGAIRIVTPDLDRWVRAYLADEKAFFGTVMPAVPSSTEGLNALFYEPTHRFIHDFGSLSAELRRCGFEPIYRSAWRESRYPAMNLDAEWEHRRLESLYVEAVRPL